jgi:hypothetical protein
VARCGLNVSGSVADSCEHGNEPLDSINGGKILD